MAVFTSRRERRLWVLTGFVVATIYSTLGLARTLSDELRNRGLFDTFFVWGFVFLVVAVVVHALVNRPGRAEIGVAIGIAGVYLMLMARLGIPEERTHLFEYSLVAVLIHSALSERRAQGGQVPAPAAVAIVATAMVGWLDEGIQALLPNRFYDLRDVGFNALAGFMAVVATIVLRRARSWQARVRE